MFSLLYSLIFPIHQLTPWVQTTLCLFWSVSGILLLPKVALSAEVESDALEANNSVLFIGTEL